MKTSELKKYIVNVKKFNPGKNTLPILDNILISDQMLIVSNLEVIYKVKFDDLDPGLNVLIDIRYLEQIVKKVKSLEIDINTPGKIITNKGSFNYNLEYYDVSEFPEFGFTPKKEIGSLNIDAISTLKNAVNYTGNDYLRQVMTGVFINKDKIVATDAHYLMFKDHNCNISEDFIIPANAVNMLSEKDYSITYNTKGNDTQLLSEMYCFENGNEQIIFRGIDGKYPNFDAVIPKENPITVNLCKPNFIEILTLAQISANKSTKNIIIELKDGDVFVTSKDEDFKRAYSGQVPGGNYNTVDPFIIGFNSALLLKCLKFMPDNISIEMSLSNRAIIINGYMLLMPVMLDK